VVVILKYQLEHKHLRLCNTYKACKDSETRRYRAEGWPGR